MSDAVRYTERVNIHLPAGATAFMQAMAREGSTKQAEVQRQLMLKALKAEGFVPAAIPDRSAGALYDALNGKQSYALVSAGRVLGVVQYADRPDLADVDHRPAGYVPADGDAWLPIVHVDSEPFDPSQHYRLPPVERVEAGRVVREFPIIPKDAA